MKPEKLIGIMPALLTGFTDDGSALDLNRTQKLLDFVIKKGVNGVYVGGSSGEMLLLSNDERKALLEAVMEVAKGKISVIVHVGGAGTREAVDLARHAAKAGADAVSAVTPLYFGYTFANVKSYYSAIANASELPCIVYNIPSLSGMKLTLAQMEELLNLPNVAGMKFTATDFFQLERLRTKFPDKVLYNGFDEMLIAGLSVGADGGIGTTYNYQPERILGIYRLFKEGKAEEARKLQVKANELIEAVCKYSVMPASKEVLAIGGMPYGTCRAPFLPLDDDAKADLRKAVIENLGENFMVL